VSAATPARWRPSRAEVDPRAIAANVARIAAASGAEVCAVVKADGYGHGAVRAARAALAGGATWLAVALVEEGVELRAAGIEAPVLLLSEPPHAAIEAVIEHRLTPTVYRPETIAALGIAAVGRGTTVAVHAKLDTGMSRVGADEPSWDAVLTLLAATAGVVVEGVWTHLACAEDRAADANAQQLAAFERALAAVAAAGLAPTIVHAANTAGALDLPAAARTMVRAGIGVYGASPGGDVLASAHALVPALEVVSEVSFVKRITAGTGVSYGLRWHAPRDGWLATVPIGYADGVPRAATGSAEVLLGGQRRPVAGTITMDQLMVWCDADRPSVGDEVVVIGERDGLAVRAEDWAAWAGTIPYEVLTGLGPRLPRVEVDRGRGHGRPGGPAPIAHA